MKKQKTYNPEPPVNGVMTCPNDHSWNVTLLNPERKTVICSVCGVPTVIRQALEQR